MSADVATLGGGCFWCLEAVYELLEGVERVESGYAGGDEPNPTYERVCAGVTGHVEVVQVSFDPGVVSYREILEIFFATHDPTTLNHQGPDTGTQYRSGIYTYDEKQAEQAAASKDIYQQALTEAGADVIAAAKAVCYRS